MRISTSQLYDAGALNIQRNQGEVFKSYNQISTGRRVLTPADDPVAAAQALVVTQSKEVTAQHIANQDNATSQLGQIDSQLSSLTDLLQNVRERVVQAGNTTLSNSDRRAIANELDARLSEMLGIANSDNGSGDFLFSGYQGGTRPFAVSAAAAIPPATTLPVAYFGDDGERLLQVSSSRQMGVSVAGSSVFMNAKNGNGTFATATGGSAGVTASINQGTATIDAGSVLDLQKWQAGIDDPAWAAPTAPTVQIRFAVDAVTGVTTYQLFDFSAGVGGEVAITDPLQPFTPGQAISLVAPNPPSAFAATDFGAQVVVAGNPANDDTFTIKPSTNQSLFQTMQNVIGVLRSTADPASSTTTEYVNNLGGQLTNLDQALSNVSQVQSTVGTRMREVESLNNASGDLAIQYSSTLSKLQDLDYAKAITDFTKQQVNLEAAQKSFVSISGLSLFKYI